MNYNIKKASQNYHIKVNSHYDFSHSCAALFKTIYNVKVLSIEGPPGELLHVKSKIQITISFNGNIWLKLIKKVSNRAGLKEPSTYVSSIIVWRA